MFWHLVGDIISMDVYLDGNQVSHHDMRNSSSSTSFSVGINQLSLGPHMINVTASCLTYYLGPLYSNSSVNTGPQTNHGPVMGFPIVVSDTINFTVNPQLTPTRIPTPSVSTNFPEPTPSPTQQLIPKISILFPLNDSFYNVSIEGVNFQLIYNTNTVLSWVGYSINGANNVTVTGNSTYVHDFESSGYHTLIVYANDTSGNWATPQTVTYLVNFYPDYAPTPSPSLTQQPTMEPSPINLGPAPTNLTPDLIIVALAVAVVVVIVALLVYLVKRKAVK
jgi:hypothetical protein